MLNKKHFFFTCIVGLAVISTSWFLCSKSFSSLLQCRIEQHYPSLRIHHCTVKNLWTISLYDLQIEQDHYAIKAAQATVSLNFLALLRGRIRFKKLLLIEPSCFVKISKIPNKSTTSNLRDLFTTLRTVQVENGSFQVLYTSLDGEHRFRIDQCFFSFSSDKRDFHHIDGTITCSSTWIKDSFSCHIQGEELFDQLEEKHVLGSFRELSETPFFANALPLTWEYRDKASRGLSLCELNITQGHDILIEASWAHERNSQKFKISNLTIHTPFVSIKGQLAVVEDHWSEHSMLSFAVPPNFFLSSISEHAHWDLGIRGEWKNPQLFLLNRNVEKQNEKQVSDREWLSPWSCERNSKAHTRWQCMYEFSQGNLLRKLNMELEWSLDQEMQLLKSSWNLYGDIPWRENASIWIESTGKIELKTDQGIYLHKVIHHHYLRPSLHILPTVHCSFFASKTSPDDPRLSYKLTLHVQEWEGKVFELNSAKCSIQCFPEKSFLEFLCAGYSRGVPIQGSFYASIVHLGYEQLEILGEKFSGTINDVPFSLLKPFRISLQTDLLALSTVNLKLGNGFIQTELIQTWEHLRGFITLDAVPFSVINVLLGTEEAGICTGKLSVNISESEKLIKLHLYGKNRSQYSQRQLRSFRLEAKLDHNAMESTLIWDDQEQSRHSLKGVLPISLANTYPYITYCPKHVFVLDAHLTIPISWIRSYMPIENVSLVEGSCAIRGKITGPNWFVSGEVELIDVSMTLNKNVFLTVSNINGRFLCQGERIEWHNLFGNTKMVGTIFSTGVASWEDRWCAAIAIDVNRAFFSYCGIADGQGSGHLDMSLAEDHNRIEGTLNIDTANMWLFQAAASPKSRLRPANFKSSEKTYSFDLNIHLHSTKDIFVYGEGIASEWKGHVHLSGTTTTPLFQGSCKAIYGTLDIGEHYFSLLNGDLEFKGDLSTSPIRIVASLLISKYKITAILDGTLGDPKISLSADPKNLSPEKIVKLLLFGTADNRDTIDVLQAIQKVEKPFHPKQSTSELVHILKRSLHIDHLGLLTSSHNRKRLYTLQLGKRIRRNIFLILEKKLTNHEGQAGINLQLSPSLSFRVKAGLPKTGSLHILWRLNY